MTDPERQQRVDDLCEAALDRDPFDRSEFIAGACGGDESLRHEVEALLSHASRADQFLATPIGRMAAEVLGDERGASLVGRQVGAYQVVSHLGSGGMGVVYRARDTGLEREVAIKILPRAFRDDPDRLGRFEREAKVLAALNHPHIGAIYGLEHTDGGKALVMELVDGEDLSQRIARGAVPIADALPIARQIAEALEAAHEQGIVHLDLKPANIKVRRDGTVKVLDFGLAKALAPASNDLPAPVRIPTEVGVITGTPAYMSPEQARGEAADRRADIWSFGVVLYELLTGASPFGRRTTADTLASVLGTQPDYTRLPLDTPATAHHLIRRCLEKDRKRRLQHMGDVRLEVEEALAALTTEAPLRPATDVAANGRRWRAVGVIALAVFAGVTVWLLGQRSVDPTPAGVVRLSLASFRSPSRLTIGGRHLAISGDGSRVAYASEDRLWIRRLGQKEAVAVAVTASNPFFSPNGEWVGFFSQTGDWGLKKVPVLGGTPVPIVATSQRPGGGTWRADGTIVFATSEGLYRVSENGGEARLLMKPDPSRKERAYAWPQFMPDGQSVLFTIVPEGSIDGAQVALLDLKALDTSIVLKGGSAGRYASTGHLVYASGQTLKAIVFDAETRRTRGDPVALPDIEIANTPDNGAAEFAVSETGTLLFIPPTVVGLPLRTLSWVDRHGKEEPLTIAPNQYAHARISPDGTRVALDIVGANRDIWTWNLRRASLTKLTDGPTEDMVPVWSRDGSRVFFASDRMGTFDVYSRAADGATTERVEYAGPGFQTATAFTPDGTRLLVRENFNDLSLLNPARSDRLEPLLQSESNEWLAEVSPDGNWLAYESNESGDQVEIFLRPFPDVGRRREKVSIDGGRYPLWGPRGSDELFYVDLNGGMMAASVRLSPRLVLGRVTKLFDWEQPPRGTSGMRYDISPVDGRFLMMKTAKTDAVVEISVVLNWFQELRERVPLQAR